MVRNGDHVERMVDFFDRFETVLHSPYPGALRSLDPDAGSSGLTDDEIAVVATDQGVEVLPAYFREFLRRMGRNAGRFWIGSCGFFPEILGIKGAAQELLAENGEVGLMPDDAVVFMMHQGYQFYWMHPRSGDNPPVLGYTETKCGIFCRWESYSDFLEEELQEEQLGPPPL